MPAERADYAAAQAQLLGSLIAGEDFPAGFATDGAAAASAALRRKRGRAVARAWPALALEQGFDDRFDAFARTVGAPAAGGGLADGLAFVRTLDRRQLSDDARVELLFARRRLLSAVVLHEPHRLLLVVRRWSVTLGR